MERQRMERRAEPRHSIDLRAAWSDGRRARMGTVRDISRHGVFLVPSWAPTDPLEPGMELGLLCRLPGREVDLAGVVRWVGHSDEHGGDGLGLRITSEEELAALIPLLEMEGVLQ